MVNTSCISCSLIDLSCYSISLNLEATRSCSKLTNRLFSCIVIVICSMESSMFDWNLDRVSDFMSSIRRALSALRECIWDFRSDSSSRNLWEMSLKSRSMRSDRIFGAESTTGFYSFKVFERRLISDEIFLSISSEIKPKTPTEISSY